MIPSPANTTLIFGKDTAGLDAPIGITAGVQATVTLTSDNTVAAAGDTVTLGSVTYTFKTALTGADNEILIVAADADGTLLNLINAINGSGAKINGVDFLTKRIGHPQVTAATSVTAHAFVVTAIDGGVAGNLIASTETSGHLSFGATTLTGGTNASLSVSTAAGSGVGSTSFAVTHVTALANGTSSLAARTGRRGYSIRCLTASPEAIYYGPTTGVTAVSGAKLAVGESQNVDTSAACFVMSSGGTGLVEFVETY